MSELRLLLGLRALRDRTQLLVWALITTTFAALSWFAMTGQFGGEQDRAATIMLSVANPAIMVISGGLPSGADEGPFVAFQIQPWLLLLAALMSVFLATRHSRGDEERGRAELVQATPAGRVTPLLATIVHGSLANLLLGVLSAAALIAIGLPVTGSLLTGLSITATGIVYLGVVLLAAQWLPTSRATNSLGVWVVITGFLLCGAGSAMGTVSDDLLRVTSAWPAWLSPFGWAANIRPWDADQPAPLLLSLVLAVVVMTLAVVVQRRRDLDASLTRVRTGPAGSTRLHTVSGLIWRLNATALVGWGLGALLLGISATSLTVALAGFGEQSQAALDMLRALSPQADLIDAGLSVHYLMLGAMAGCLAVQLIAGARQEEASGRVELLWTTPVSRLRWLADNLALALLGAGLIMAVAVLGGMLGLALTDGDWTLMRAVGVQALGQWVAGAVFGVLAALLLVFRPRLTAALGWSLVGLSASVGMFAPLMGAPGWTRHLAPIASAAFLSDQGIELRDTGWTLALLVVGLALALWGMRRRELVPAD